MTCNVVQVFCSDQQMVQYADNIRPRGCSSFWIYPVSDPQPPPWVLFEGLCPTKTTATHPYMVAEGRRGMANVATVDFLCPGRPTVFLLLNGTQFKPRASMDIDHALSKLRRSHPQHSRAFKGDRIDLFHAQAIIEPDRQGNPFLAWQLLWNVCVAW